MIFRRKKIVFFRLEGIPSSEDLIERLQTLIDNNEINLIQARQERCLILKYNTL